MEICQDGADCFEVETWVDEQVCGGVAGKDFSSAAADGMFESSNRGGAYGDDATRSVKSQVYRGRCGDRDGICFGVNFVVFNAHNMDWLEGSEADVQRDLGGLDTALADAREGFRRKMKAGGGSSHGTTLPGVDGLIALAIMGRIRAGDVGGKRDVADAVEGGAEIGLRRAIFFIE